VRQGGTWQNVLSILKIAAIAAIVVVCLPAHVPTAAPAATYAFGSPSSLAGALGVAMLPVLFTYNGFQNATIVTGETIEPQRAIPRALIAGIAIVIVLYVCVNLAYLHALGAAALAVSRVPAAAAMHAAVGAIGEKLIAAAIAVSVLGYLSTCMLVHPRVYYQMAADGYFFRSIGWISSATHVPVVAILLQAVVTSLIAVSGTYEQIVNWVVLPQWTFMGLAPALALFIFRKRDAGKPLPAIRVPGHPYTTGLFIAAVAAILAAEFAVYPRDTLYGLAVFGSGAIAFALLRASSSDAKRR
jgi:APA family basic amino acid/polyamine antiporter